MYSLRAVFSAAGDKTPPFSLRALLRDNAVKPPTMRGGIEKLGLLQEQVELFRSYALRDNLLTGILDELPTKKVDLPDLDDNDEARKLQDDKFALRAKLEALVPHAGVVKKKLRAIHDLIVTRQAQSAEALIDGLPTGEIAIMKADDPIWSNALRPDDVEGVVLGGPTGTVPQKVIFRGYDGPTVTQAERQTIQDIALFLRPKSAERRMRVNLLTAESLLARRQFEEAVARYRQMLDGGGLSLTEREFVALRMATAQNAVGDRAFNALPPDDTAARLAAREKYVATTAILQAAGISGGDPVARTLMDHAAVQLFLIDHGFNALGSAAIVTAPTKSAAALALDADRRVSIATSAIQSFKSFVDTLETTSEQDIKIQIDINAAKQAQDDLRTELDVLAAEVDKLDTQRNFLSAMLGIEAVSAFGAIILIAAGGPPGTDPTKAEKANSTGGKVTGGANSAGRIVDLLRQIALIGIDKRILRLKADSLSAQIATAQEHQALLDVLEATTTVKLNKYVDLANRFEELTVDAMRAALRAAFQAEVRLAFERGTSGRLGIVKTELLDYKNDQELFERHQDLQTMLADLNSAIEESIQRTIVRRRLTLSQHNPLALARLQQTGETEFAVSLYDVDRLSPGAPNVRITDVAVQFPTNTFKSKDVGVTLTHRGVFLVRDSSSLREATQIIPDAADVEQAGAVFREGRSLTVKGVTFINAGENTRPFALPMVVPDKAEPIPQRQGLEGYGLSGLWKLKINPNQLDQVIFANLRDVDLFFFVAEEEPLTEFQEHVNGLIRAFEEGQEKEQGDVLDRVTFFGMRDQFPDALDTLLDANPPGGVDIDADDVLTEEAAKTLLKAVVLQVVGDDDKGLVGIGLRLSKKVSGREPIVFDLETTTGGFTTDLGEDIPILEPADRFPIGGAWTLGVTSGDTQGIDNIQWFFVHEARTHTRL